MEKRNFNEVMMKNLQIAIDGPAGSGKSTVAKRIASELNILYLDTGAMYRALTWFVLNEEKNVKSESDVLECLTHFDLVFSDQKILLNGVNITEFIREPFISDNVSYVAKHGAVRKKMVTLQQKIAGEQPVIMDGRDIGTHVLPFSKYKFFLNATVEERAKRRFKELQDKGGKNNYQDVETAIIKRDRLDSEREHAPLRQAEDAILIDTTNLDIDEVTLKIITLVKEGTNE